MAMKLAEALQEKKNKILNVWIDRTLDSYSSSGFFKKSLDAIANPIGTNIRDGLTEILNLLLPSATVTVAQSPGLPAAQREFSALIFRFTVCCPNNCYSLAIVILFNIYLFFVIVYCYFQLILLLHQQSKIFILALLTIVFKHPLPKRF